MTAPPRYPRCSAICAPLAPGWRSISCARSSATRAQLLKQLGIELPRVPPTQVVKFAQGRPKYSGSGSLQAALQLLGRERTVPEPLSTQPVAAAGEP